MLYKQKEKQSKQESINKFDPFFNYVVIVTYLWMKYDICMTN